MQTTEQTGNMLRRALQANTAFCVVSGTVLAAAADPLSEFSGLDPRLLRVVGAGLIIWAAVMFGFVARPALRRQEVLAVIAADIGWVIGSVVAVASAAASFTDAGLMTFIALGVIVADFAAAQIIGLRRETARA